MNERIKELAEQANGPNPFFGALKNQTVLLGDNAVAKFAELIVRDCLEQVRAEVQYEYDWKLADAVPKRVLEHFGVE